MMIRAMESHPAKRLLVQSMLFTVDASLLRHATLVSTPSARLVRALVVGIVAAVWTFRDRLTFVHANRVIAFLTMKGSALARLFTGMRCHVLLLSFKFALQDRGCLQQRALILRQALCASEYNPAAQT